MIDAVLARRPLAVAGGVSRRAGLTTLPDRSLSP